MTDQPIDAQSIDALRRVPIFAALDDDALRSIAEVGTQFRAAAGYVLVERGQPGTGCFVIEEGSVRVELPSGDEVERGAGDFFGELSLLSSSPRTARVVAATDVLCIAIRRDDLERLLHDEPSIAIAMLSELANRLAEVT
jgi:CRP/FNR family transcriptional regulator